MWTSEEKALLDRVRKSGGDPKTIHARWTKKARAAVGADPTMKSQFSARTVKMVNERMKTVRKNDKNANKRKQPDPS
jgi:hypothetical protein